MSPLEALQVLMGPLTGPAQVLEALADSPVSATWLVVVGGRKAVLRVDRPLATRLGLPRAAEPGLLRALAVSGAAGGLAPAVIAADPARGLLLTEWLAGATLQAGSSLGPEGLEGVGRLLRAVHATVIDAPRLDLAAVIARYVELAGPDGGAVGADARDRLTRCQGLPGLPVAFCHNDPSPANILVAPPGTFTGNDSGLRLIDWEYAARNHPEFDLAVFVAEAGLDTAGVSGLLAAYLGRPPEPADRARQDAWLAFYRSLSVLWERAVRGGADYGRSRLQSS